MKNIILKSITWIMVAILLLSICMLDSVSWIPAIACGIALAWIVLFAYANKERLEEFEDGR